VEVGMGKEDESEKNDHANCIHIIINQKYNARRAYIYIWQWLAYGHPYAKSSC